MGRPAGTFGDPAFRARAWHWLGKVQSIADVERARQLDRHPSLVQGNSANKLHFDLIRQDGYDPARMAVRPATSLLEFVTDKPRYKPTRADYQHPLWLHLIKRSPLWPARDAWLSSQLKRHSIVRISPVDQSNGVELGLLPDIEPDFSVPPPLNLRPDRFATLDGLLLLLILLREAQDATYATRAARFVECLRRAAMEFSKLCGYAGEHLDTWEVLIESRMAAWRPNIEPTVAQLKSAEQALKREMFEPNRRGRKPNDPSALAPHSRSERRWRRRVWIRACNLHLGEDLWQPSFDYRDASLPYEWLIENRDAIGLQMSRAIELLVVGEAVGELPSPLSMPDELHASRKRKAASEAEEQVYGYELPFDVIPVAPRSSGKA